MPATAPDETNELFEAAINSGDVDAALALYESEACLVASPGEPVFGLDAIRVVLQGFVAAKPTLMMEPSAVLQVGDLALTAHAWQPGTVPTARSNSPAARPKSCADRRTTRGVSSSTIPAGDEPGRLADSWPGRSALRLQGRASSIWDRRCGAVRSAWKLRGRS
jgi:uncharacterized protein (TIGR02246 family)